MKEDFLHQVWRLQLFKKGEMLLSDLGEVLVLKPGLKNRNAGPDFEQSKIKMAGLDWVGSIEIHVRSSEWNQHGHQDDPAYESVILHVVWEADQAVFRKDGTQVPCLELKNLIPLEVIFRYRELLENQKNETGIPCGSFLKNLDSFLFFSMKERVLVERFERKAEAIQHRYRQMGKDWLATLYQTLAWGLGLKINAEAMEMLAFSIPFRQAATLKDNPFSLSALFLGQAGFLAREKGPISEKLSAEFQHLKIRFKLQSTQFPWKKFRLRPGAFPEQRVCLFICLVLHLPDWLQQVENSGSPAALFLNMEKDPAKELLVSFLKELDLDGSKVRLTSFLKNNLIINVFSPYLVAMGLEQNDRAKIEKAIDWVSGLNPENNEITRKWKLYGLEPDSAASSQAFLELYTQYCQQKRCMECQVGAGILKIKP
jgi:hypothetical protein